MSRRTAPTELPKGIRIRQLPNGTWVGEVNQIGEEAGPVASRTGNAKNKLRFLGKSREEVIVKLTGEDQVPVVELAPDAPKVVSDKKVGEFNWRDWTDWIETGRELRHKASFDQDRSEIRVESDTPVCVLFLSDTHVGSWAADHDLFRRITDEILATSGLYIGLLGDVAEMAIRLRGVAEVTGNILPPELQARYVESWLEEVGPRILFSTWDNHAVEREEAGTGISAFAELLKRRVVYHNGIGHTDLIVGKETYHLAVSHRFPGSSLDHPCHGGVRHLTREAHGRELAASGDRHRAGIEFLSSQHGDYRPRIAVNTGTLQLQSPYARRHFSLFSAPVFPCVTFHPEKHLITPFWSIESWHESRLR